MHTRCTVVVAHENKQRQTRLLGDVVSFGAHLYQPKNTRGRYFQQSRQHVQQVRIAPPCSTRVAQLLIYRFAPLTAGCFVRSTHACMHVILVNFRRRLFVPSVQSLEKSVSAASATRDHFMYILAHITCFVCMALAGNNDAGI